MVTIELPPEVAADAGPYAAQRPGRPLLTHQQDWRLQGLVKNLVNPTVVAETAGLLEQQTADIHAAFAPRNAWQDWVTGTIATVILRLNRCERIERKLRDLASYRAILFWEDDQQLAVETVALKIGKEPGKTVARLRETPAGIDWLLARWRILARVEPHDWTDAQRDLASRLVGGEPLADPTRDGFVAARIDELEGHRARIVEADAIIRGLVEADLSDARVPGLAALRRYTRSLQRQLKWYVDQFHVEHPDRWDDPRRRPASAGPAVEAYRAPNPNRFEGKASWVAATEAAGGPTPGKFQTNPTAASAAPGKWKTKPFSPVAVAAGVAPSVPEPANEPAAVIHDYATEPGRHHGRPLRAGERSREYARRQRAARRRTNLDLIERL